MIRVINTETIAKERYKDGYSTPVNMFKGDKEYNLMVQDPQKIGKTRIVKMGSEKWHNSVGYNKLWTEIEDLHRKINAAQAPSSSDITDLLGKLFIDITRRQQESPDLTNRICTEITNLNFDETINLRQIYKYRGEMQQIEGTGDSVPLIEQDTGRVETATMAIYALGWKTSLKNILFNRLHEMEKVTQAAVDADTDLRNSKVIGEIVGSTFDSSQTVAADTTSGATYDVKMYNTFRKAIKTLRNLKDYRGPSGEERKINANRLGIICNSYDSWSIQRVISGQLTTGGANGTITTQNLQALPVGEIVEYDQGITDGFTWGKKTLSFDGVTAGTCYLYVPQEYAWVLNKRPLTLEMGTGEDVLSLSQEQRAWYRVQTEWLKPLLGSTYSGFSKGSGYGAIVEITLPTDS
jgi:hypothetical protein